MQFLEIPSSCPSHVYVSDFDDSRSKHYSVGETLFLLEEPGKLIMLNTKALARHVSYFGIIGFKYYLVDKEISTWRALETNSA